jgi:hypothetical protein
MRKLLWLPLAALFLVVLACSNQEVAQKGDDTAVPDSGRSMQPPAAADSSTAAPQAPQRDCSTYDSPSQDAADCFERMASDNKDPAVCGLIEGIEFEGIRKTCYSSVAAALQDESVCDDMTLPDSEEYQVELERGICKEFVKSQSGIVAKPSTAVPMSGVTLEQCQAMTDQEQMSTGQCYFRVAVFAKDYAICNNILGSINQQTRIMCYNEIANALQDPAVCDAMEVPTTESLDLAKQQCRQYAATTK